MHSMSEFPRIDCYRIVYNVSTKPLQSQLRIVLGEYGQCGEIGLTKPLLSGGEPAEPEGSTVFKF